MLPREHRLTKKAAFDAAFASGRRWGAQRLSLQTLPNGADNFRCGFTASKAVGNAVVRNRVKRRLRAIVRDAGVVAGYDLVVVARRAAADAPFAGLRDELLGLLRRAGVLGLGAESGASAVSGASAESGASADGGPAPTNGEVR